MSSSLAFFGSWASSITAEDPARANRRATASSILSDSAGPRFRFSNAGPRSTAIGSEAIARVAKPATAGSAVVATSDETNNQFGERRERVLRRFIEVPQDAGELNCSQNIGVSERDGV